MFRKKTPTRIALSLLAGLTAVSLAACSDTASPGSGGGGAQSSGAKPQVTFIQKLAGTSYFTAAFKGSTKAAQELGGEVKELAPSTPTAAEQIPFINSSIAQGVRGIAVGGNDKEALAPSLKQAMEQGIKVVSYDSDVAKDARTLFCNQASPVAISEAMDKVMADDIGAEGGEFAILSSNPTNTNQNTYIDAIKADIQKNYPKLKLVEIAYGEDATDKIQQTVRNLVQSYPNLKGITAITAVALPAAAAAVSDLGLKGKVHVTGLATPNDMKKYVADGTVRAFVLWDAVKLGYMTYYAVAALESGQIEGKEGETFKAGDAGKFTIGKDGEVLLGDPVTFTKDNIANYNF